MELEEQYDKIYRYCYFKVRRREIAEDITQETFLRFFERRVNISRSQSLQYLYTIARHLCVDEYRKHKTRPLEDEPVGNYSDDHMITQISVRVTLSELDEADRELLLLRYVNEVPIHVISKLYGISRFSVYRKILQATKELKKKLRREDFM